MSEQNLSLLKQVTGDQNFKPAPAEPEASYKGTEELNSDKSSSAQKKYKKNANTPSVSVHDILSRVDEKNKTVYKASVIAHVPVYISDWINESARKAGKSKSAYLTSILEEFYKATNGD